LAPEGERLAEQPGGVPGGRLAVETGTADLEITINRDFHSYTKEEQDELLAVIRTFLGITGDVRVRAKRPGSVKLTLELTAEEAERLKWAIKGGHFKQFGAEDAEIVENTDPSTPAPPVTPFNERASFRGGVLRPADTEELRGHLGRYELLENIGRGPFGAVWKARDPELDRLVAIKVPYVSQLRAYGEVDLFLREARTVARFEHPSIVAVLDSGRDAGRPFLVTQFIHGVSLAERLRRGPFTPTAAAALVAEIAAALNHAHERGIIHGLVKPSNILLDVEGRPYVTDLGLTRLDVAKPTFIAQGELVCTPAYFSPEQVRGDSLRLDARSDIYSLGVVLYEMLCGDLPFGRRLTPSELAFQIAHEEPRPPRQLNDKIPPDLETICLKALAKRTSDRYATAQELADDLDHFLHGEPIRARRVSRLGRLARWCRRNPALVSAIVAMVLSIAGMVIGIHRFLFGP
jgi:Protein kinase domain